VDPSIELVHSRQGNLPVAVATRLWRVTRLSAC
jgi:hypothetical protein